MSAVDREDACNAAMGRFQRTCCAMTMRRIEERIRALPAVEPGEYEAAAVALAEATVKIEGIEDGAPSLARLDSEEYERGCDEYVAALARFRAAKEARDAE